MDFVRNIKEKTVAISDFNKGQAGKIFDEVNKKGPKFVFKNNSPECVLISVDDYSKLLDEIEDLKDLILAEKRMKSLKEEDLISQEEFEKLAGISLEDTQAIDLDEILWNTN